MVSSWLRTLAAGPLRGTARLGLAAIACSSFATGSAALTVQPFNFSGAPIEGGDDPTFFPDVTVEFSFDETCMTSSCQLMITLTYNGSNQANLSAIGQALAGVSFDTFSMGSPFDLDVDLDTSTATGESVVGAGSDDALSDFGGPPNSNLDVSRHWGFRSGFVSGGSLGGAILSSVGDAFPDTDVLGMGDLFTSGTLSDVETNPPDGTSFSIVDDDTCTGPPGSPSCGGLGGGFQDSQNRAWIQNELTATLVYDGTTNKLTSIGNVDPLFGTEGRPLEAPEPGVFGLMALGVGGLFRYACRRLPSWPTPGPPHPASSGASSRVRPVMRTLASQSSRARSPS